MYFCLGLQETSFFLSVSKTDSGKVKAVSASGSDEEKEGRIIEKTKKLKKLKKTKDVVEMKKNIKEINFSSLQLVWNYYKTGKI